jgi:4-hydroxy-4-methyl-2-oxoglutarate aldolase
MKRAFLLLLGSAALFAQAPPAPFSQAYIPAKPFTEAENRALVQKFQGMRVTDVVDGLDVVGLQDMTIMDPAIHPLWRDEKEFTHRIYGAAVTLRIVPPRERAPNFASHDEFAKWESQWYREKIPGGFERWLGPDTILVIDASRTKDVGFCGSNNALGWFTRGMRGVVIDGGCRDSDENILQRIPIYQRDSTRGIDPGRVMIESYNQPVNVGGVTVLPGDIIVADTEGVVVVPRDKAEAVAAAAKRIQDSDKKARLRLYEKLGKPADFTVK